MTQNSQNYQSVTDFYTGRSVFITGATGFLGKAYVEKLAYECRQIDNIYILIRFKKSLNIDEFIQKYLDQPFFVRLKQDRQELMSKIIPILGDITLPNLGLKNEDRQTLIDKVSVVIHCAAAIKFNQVLKDAININVEGTRRVLNLAKVMKNKCIFVYVSTAYSNAKESVVEEIIYPPPADLEDVKKIAMKAQHYILREDDEEIFKLIRGHPNTYTFSKALAEHVVAQNHEHLAAIIVRPSIITAAEREPVQSWIDNLSAASGIIAGMAKGWLHVMLSKDNVVIDLIPLDYVANLTILAASRIPQQPGVTVYHSCTSSTNPITFQEAYKYVKEYSIQHNTCDWPYYVAMIFTQHVSAVSALTFLMQTLPAFLADVWLWCKRKQPKYIKQQRKVARSRDALNFFSTHSWEIRCQKALSLFMSLSPQDRERFRCDPRLVDWRQYIYNYHMGIERYLSSKSKNGKN